MCDDIKYIYRSHIYIYNLEICVYIYIYVIYDLCMSQTENRPCCDVCMSCCK